MSNPVENSVPVRMSGTFVNPSAKKGTNLVDSLRTAFNGVPKSIQNWTENNVRDVENRKIPTSVKNISVAALKALGFVAAWGSRAYLAIPKGVTFAGVGMLYLLGKGLKKLSNFDPYKAGEESLPTAKPATLSEKAALFFNKFSDELADPLEVVDDPLDDAHFAAAVDEVLGETDKSRPTKKTVSSLNLAQAFMPSDTDYESGSEKTFGSALSPLREQDSECEFDLEGLPEAVPMENPLENRLEQQVSPHLKKPVKLLGEGLDKDFETLLERTGPTFYINRNEMDEKRQKVLKHGEMIINLKKDIKEKHKTILAEYKAIDQANLLSAAMSKVSKELNLDAIDVVEPLWKSNKEKIKEKQETISDLKKAIELSSQRCAKSTQEYKEVLSTMPHSEIVNSIDELQIEIEMLNREIKSLSFQIEKKERGKTPIVVKELSFKQKVAGVISQILKALRKCLKSEKSIRFKEEDTRIPDTYTKNPAYGVEQKESSQETSLMRFQNSHPELVKIDKEGLFKEIESDTREAIL